MKNDVLFYFDEISIRSIIKDVLKNFWMIILVALSAVLLISGYQSFIYQPEYTSKATLVISAKGSGSTDAYASLTTTMEMAEVFSNVFSSNVLKKRLDETLDMQDMNFKISAQTIPETNLMVVRVTGAHPKTVYQAICGAIEHYAEVSDYVFTNAVLDVMENPEVPMYPSNTLPLNSYKKKGALLAGALMGAFIVFMSVMRNTVKTEAAAKRRINGTRLAVVEHEEKNRTLKAKIKAKNKAILITNPVTTFGYVEIFKKLAFRVQNEMEKKNGKILLVSSVGENEGKSTVATNLALALTQAGKKVILADIDLRRPAIYKIFDIKSDNKEGFWQEEIVVSGQNKLKLWLNRRIWKNPATYMKNIGIEELTKQSRMEADYIIIDSSPMNVAADTEIILSYVDAALLVIRQDWSSVSDINYFIGILEKGEKEFLGYVLNDFVDYKPFKKSVYKGNYWR